MRRFLFIFFACSFAWASSLQPPKKVVLITGASRGIGLATAQELANRGYRVYAGVRNTEALDATLLHPEIYPQTIDVSDESTIQRAVQTILQTEGRIDILINNAGYGLAGPLECLSMEEIYDQMDVNFFGAIRMCQAVLPQMRKQKSGRILNISSEQGIYGLPYGSLYTCSKAALESLSEALRVELSPWNIFVSIVEPSAVATNFSLKLGSRTIDQTPYAKICERLELSLLEPREPSETCQTAQEVAQFVLQVIEHPKPLLRYQTSKAAEEAVSRFHKDMSGQEYVNWITPIINDYYSLDEN